VVLYRRDRATYVNEGHGHRVTISGNLGWLTGKIYHDDRKPLSRWFATQQHYAAEEANYMLSSNRGALQGFDRIRLTGWLAPAVAFLHALIVKGCLFDGWPGWYYALQRLLAETMITLEIIDRRLRRDG
jgi:hypothetical protein